MKCLTNTCNYFEMIQCSESHGVGPPVPLGHCALGEWKLHTEFNSHGTLLRVLFQVFKGFDWISRLLFHEDDLLVVGFHAVSFTVDIL